MCQYNNTSGLLWHQQGDVQDSCLATIFDALEVRMCCTSYTSCGINIIACLVKQHINYENMKESLNSQNTAMAERTSSKYTEKKWCRMY